ncbi:sensor histidine kinase [Herbaspirillum rhizosphaerae]|uniref:sensor histidine kinase n=1 Tax=Herbaspirillum rhizosphaerae TaxID=346179 RepID=UPI0009FA14E4|nr:ATP-binding protein [Herbaspirillum rhizosphaerae]
MFISARSPLLPITAGILTVTIFAIDALTPLDIAIAVLYVVVVLLSVAAWPRRGVVAMTSLCIVLTVVAYATSHGLAIYDAALARCLVSLAAIAITAFLALKGQAAANALIQREEALHQAQTQLAHTSRVTTLGELAASIAHEVNQPLAAIATHGEACLRWLNRPQPDLEEARMAVDGMLRDAHRASEIIRRIRAMARKAEPSYVALNLSEVARESCDLVQRELARTGVQLSLELQDDLPPVRADRVQLQQVVINLLMNGIQAMTEAHSKDRSLSVTSSLCRTEEGECVALTVSDTGPGFPVAHIGRLFEAFFTTKKDGMGMGLPICRSIIEAHGGRIQAQNNALRGAAISFHLPVIAEGVIHG